jgi:hypothetical protein
MSADIGPGDFVSKVGDTQFGPFVAHGSVRRVASIGEFGWCDCGDEGQGIVIEGFAEFNWCASCAWRPVYRPKPDAFTDLLKVPDRKRVTA